MCDRITEFKSYFLNWVKEHKFILVISLALAVLSHGMAMFNKFTFHDEAIGLCNVLSTVTSGRWGLGILKEVITRFLGHPTSLPIINAGLSALFISLSAIMIQKLFSIKKKSLIIILCAVLICSPVMSWLFFYMFTAPYYMFGLMLSVGACYLVCRIKKWYTFIIAVLLQAFSVGIYQSFIPFVLSLLLFYYIVEVFFASSDKVRFGVFLKKAFYYLSFAACFIIVYFIVTKASLALLNVQLTDYMNINSMGQESLTTYLSRMLDAYVYVVSPKLYYEKNFLPHMLHSYAYYAFIIVCVILMFILVYKGLKKSVCQGLFLLLSVLLIPLAVNFIFVMVDKDTVHTLMLYSCNALFLLPVILLNMLNFDIKIRTPFTVVLCGLFAYISVANIYYNNQIYLRAELTQNRLMSNYATLITRIKSTGGYTDETPVSFININDFDDKSLKDTDGLYVNGSSLKLTTRALFHEEYNYKEQIAVLTGFAPEYRDESDFENNDVVKNMPSYPDDGSIQIVDDTIVVKF